MNEKNAYTKNKKRQKLVFMKTLKKPLKTLNKNVVDKITKLTK